MHFSDPDHRAALDALARMRRLRACLREEIAHGRGLRDMAEEIAREAERVLGAVRGKKGKWPR